MNFFNVLISYFRQGWNLLGSYPFLLVLMSSSLIVKSYFILNLGVHLRDNKNKYIKRSCFLLVILLAATMTSNFVWVLKLLHVGYDVKLNYQFCMLCLRLAWSFAIVQHHGLALFIESLVEKERLFCTRQKILMSISGLFLVIFVALSFVSVIFPSTYNAQLEMQLMTGILQYCMFPVLSLSVVVTLFKLKNKPLPRLLHKQAMVFIKAMILPYLFCEMVHVYPISIIKKKYISNYYAFYGGSTIILLYALFYCTRKIIGLRFLNIYSHAGKPTGFDFIKDFRLVLEQFSSVTNVQELQHITRTFFYQAFSIPSTKTHLYITRELNKSESILYSHEPNQHQRIVENYVNVHLYTPHKKPILQSNKILFADEIAFNKFYSRDKAYQLEMQFLKELNADAFIPILNGKQLVAYIIVDRHARLIETKGKREFYGKTEHDYMIVFVEHLRNIINLLHDKHFDNLLHQEKRLEQQVYVKHQEINQYKESIQSFMHTTHEKTGIIFYKNRRFAYGNRNARELISIDLNTHEGHPVTKKIKTVAQQVLEYKTTQTIFVDCPNNEKLVVSGIPNKEQNNAILMVYHPEISDLLSKKMELLHDPTDWSFLLCLETTKIGKQIHQLLPSNGETILNFKIKLLKLALSKNALLLDAPPDDLPSLVQLLHAASLKEQLHTIALQRQQCHEAAIKLFGINPLLGFCSSEVPLLEKLNHNGTLFIQDVDFLDIETQDHLAEFIRYGLYRRIQSERRIESSARIICSTNKNISSALQEGTVSKNLFGQLRHNFLSIPSLTSLPEDELDDLITAIVRQTIRQNIFDTLLELNSREKRKLIDTYPASLHELRTKIKHLLVEKSRRRNLETEKELFNPAQALADPDLVEASRLGKHALRDPRIMELLWKKFKNQNKIALFLGVNRSSVNRRCKKYGLL